MTPDRIPPGMHGLRLIRLRSRIGRRRLPRTRWAQTEQTAYHEWLSKTWPAGAVGARDAYESRLEAHVGERVDPAPPLALRVVSFACERDLPEHVASIRSFLTHAGVPTELAIVSDGNHSAWSRDLLRAIHPCVAVVDWRSISENEIGRAHV